MRRRVCKREKERGREGGLLVHYGREREGSEGLNDTGAVTLDHLVCIV